MSATEPRRPTVGSLFSGIGGIDLGLERAGMRVVWQSEIDPYASRVLAKHWPDVPNLGDITKVDWSTVERPDLVCGGYPCQPFSFAGRRAGTDDPRHLWPHFADAIRHLRPRWVLLENVPGHLSLGFDEVLADLASLGFDAEWELLPAAAFGAPHLRYRLFVVAHAASPGLQGRWSERRLGEGGEEVEAGRCGDVGDSKSGGRQRAMSGRTSRLGGGEIFGPEAVERLGRCSSSIGNTWAVEPDVGRVAHGVPSRVDRLKCLGNAVVPQVAEYVGRLIVNADA